MHPASETFASSRTHPRLQEWRLQVGVQQLALSMAATEAAVTLVFQPADSSQKCSWQVLSQHSRSVSPALSWFAFGTQLSLHWCLLQDLKQQVSASPPKKLERFGLLVHPSAVVQLYSWHVAAQHSSLESPGKSSALAFRLHPVSP